MSAGRIATAVEIAADVRAGRRSAVDVVEDSLERIARLNGTLNAFCEVRPAAALAAAAAIDARVAAGEDPGPLAGVPIGVKDVVWEEGIETTDGSRALLGFRPDATATLLLRLLAAGAIVVGRTNIPEFCYRGIAENPLYGRTSNPWDPGRVPGGSSGGAGAAVAVGHGAARDRLRRRRLDQDPGVAVRRGRVQGDLRRGAPRAAVARLVLADAPRAARLHGRRLRPDDGGDGRTGSARPDVAARPRRPTWRRPGRRPATCADCASPTPRTSATCASIRACARRSAPRSSGSASWAPRWSRPSPTSRTRSTPGTPSPAWTTSSRRGRCSPPGLIGADTREPDRGRQRLQRGRLRAGPQRAGRVLGGVRPLHGALRPVPDAGDGGGRVPARHDRPGGNRGRADRRALRRLVPLLLPGEPHRALRRSACRWAAPRTACRSGCSSPVAGSRTRPCCAPRPRGSGIAPWPRPPIAAAGGATEAPGDVPREELRAGMRLRGDGGVVTVLPGLQPGGRGARRGDRAPRLTVRLDPVGPGVRAAGVHVGLLLDLREGHVALGRLELALLLQIEPARQDQVDDRRTRRGR